MKASLEDISQVKKKLSVEIDAKEVNRKFNSAYGKIGKQTKIPGFRPGKVPRKILESYFGKQVEADVVSELVNESFPQAVDETKAFPLGQPELEKGPVKQNEKFIYSATMEVRPQFEVKDYLGLEAEKEIASIGEAEVDRKLEQIREANGKLESLTEPRPIQEEDFVVINYQGFENDQPLEGIKDENFLLNVGKGDFHKKFDEALVGLNKDDKKDIVIDFEEDYFNNNLRGKTVRFDVSIVDVKERNLPELNDEFAKNLGADFEDLEGLKKQIEENVVAQEENRVAQDLKRRLIGKISEGTEFEVPEALVDAEVEFSIKGIQSNFERSGANFEMAGLSPEMLEQQFRPLSESRVRERLILGQVAQQDDITISDDEFTEGLEKLAQGMGQDVETIRKYYEARGEIDILKEQMLEEKTLNYLVENAKVKEVEAGALTPDKSDETEVQ
ncbi:MAG: trigger factor [Deltaproteobacteria bacterium]|nr:trigger factor [Deltaproteobacteria bacterium]